MSRKVILLIGNLPGHLGVELLTALLQEAAGELDYHSEPLRLLIHAPTDQEEVCLRDLLEDGAHVPSLSDRTANPRDLTRARRSPIRSIRPQGMTIRRGYRF